MKKAYQKPATSIANIELTNIIAASPGMFGQNATGAAMGREGGSAWDDEDEEY